MLLAIVWTLIEATEQMRLFFPAELERGQMNY